MRPDPDLVVRARLGVFGRPVDLEMRVPAGPTRMESLLPVFRKVADTFVDAAAERSEAAGKKVSCKAGCGACCRQLVPIAEVEARAVAALVDRMPEPRRGETRRRFAAASERLREAGLLDGLLADEKLPGREMKEAGLEYFGLGIACPFLEDESCSIYEDRPVACREYLVTSPPERCADPKPEAIASVELPVRVFPALARAGTEPGRKAIRWVPLIVAPGWAAAHPDATAKRPGPELLKSVFDRFAREKEGS